LVEAALDGPEVEVAAGGLAVLEDVDGEAFLGEAAVHGVIMMRGYDSAGTLNDCQVSRSVAAVCDRSNRSNSARRSATVSAAGSTAASSSLRRSTGPAELDGLSIVIGDPPAISECRN